MSYYICQNSKEYGLLYLTYDNGHTIFRSNPLIKLKYDKMSGEKYIKDNNLNAFLVDATNKETKSCGCSK